MVESLGSRAPCHNRNLGLDEILKAVDNLAFLCGGRLLALNSYENRVYQVDIEDRDPPVAKFYRPNRWSNEAILEEHMCTSALIELEIPVVAPLVDAHGHTLHNQDPFRFALYPRRAGAGLGPGLDDPDHLERLDRLLGRIHHLGQIKPFAHRLAMEHFGVVSDQ